MTLVSQKKLRKYANIFTRRLHIIMVVLSVLGPATNVFFQRQRFFFFFFSFFFYSGFEFELPRTQTCWLLFTNENQNKAWRMTYYTLLPHMPALFVTSQTWSKWQHPRPCSDDSQTSISNSTRVFYIAFRSTAAAKHLGSLLDPFTFRPCD